MGKIDRNTVRLKRHHRLRAKVKGTAERPRLAVFRSLRQVYAQVIDDVAGRTLAAASSKDTEAGAAGDAPKTADAVAVGKLLAARAMARGITTVVFDRGGYQYHGRVKALADAAREQGLKF